eukprot:8538687-Pyramimonas_sp.AAC.1
MELVCAVSWLSWPPWAVLGLSRPVLGPSWQYGGCLGVVLAPSWAVEGPPNVVLGPTALGPSCG